MEKLNHFKNTTSEDSKWGTCYISLTSAAQNPELIQTINKFFQQELEQEEYHQITVNDDKSLEMSFYTLKEKVFLWEDVLIEAGIRANRK